MALRLQASDALAARRARHGVRARRSRSASLRVRATAVSPKSGAAVRQLYRAPGVSPGEERSLLAWAQRALSPGVVALETEACFNVQSEGELSDAEQATLEWLLRETYEPEGLTASSALAGGSNASVVEVGPRMSFSTAWCTNAVSICKSAGLERVTKLERSRRFRLVCEPGVSLTAEQLERFAARVHDRMTEQVYPEPLTSFETDAVPEPVRTVPVLAEGRSVLERLNGEMGLAFDDWDLDYYTSLFKDKMGRDPTNVELFDIAQSNSEHSRHWFFGGNLTVDGEKLDKSLFKMVKETLDANPGNSVIGFKDNSSAIRGSGPATVLWPDSPGKPSPLKERVRDLDLLLTAETHNFPSGIAPYPGAETGAGGRIRDTHATGSGSMVVAATAGYSVGNLQIEEAPAPHEDTSFVYPEGLAPPLQILIDSSNGASDYGNKFGEPLVAGFCRTFGSRMPNGERREWIKPIMFSAGFGQIDHAHLEKAEGEIGHLVVKIGGPAYRIGMGGGAASSMAGGDNKADLDFNAVQRGDGEMAQKLYRVVRTCVEMGDANPIVQIHDQGAGGNCNVVKEIIHPLGAEIDIRAVQLGDHTMSVLEIWGAEYQENDCMLIRPQDEQLLRGICARERLPMSVLGAIDGSGRVKLVDRDAPEGSMPPEDLDLGQVLGDLPKKSYDLQRAPRCAEPLEIPAGTTAQAALSRVLRLPSVCSKRFLTTKVDRSVTGLVAQQQCVGPLLLPVADVAVIAQSHTSTKGGATAIGEQPIKGVTGDYGAMARLTLGEALTNLVWARTDGLTAIKASGNWMWAPKLPGEGGGLVDAVKCLCDSMIELGVAIDGGKDSMSMAAAAPDGEKVKGPGTLVLSAYVTCPDITATVTPDLKLPGRGQLMLVDLAAGKRRLGGSALAQVYDQAGDDVPDMDDVQMFKRGWEATQALVAEGKLASGHDVSDGGLVTALLEMAFAGNCGITVDLPAAAEGQLAALFAEELGLVVEVDEADVAAVEAAYAAADVPLVRLGTTDAGDRVAVSVGGEACVEGTTPALRDEWEETSFHLERLQASHATVAEEQAGLAARVGPSWSCGITPAKTDAAVMEKADKVRVAVLREEGSNGDREMAAAFHAAGFDPWDVTMSDLLQGRMTLDRFRGVVFVGGFSYADVLDSAKGWAASIRFNGAVYEQFQRFYERPDTFSLGVCNGCQLMALLGWVPGLDAGSPLGETSQPRFVHNSSGRFESRFSTVHVGESPSIMLKALEGSTLGVWVAHGEGRALFPDGSVMDGTLAKGCAPMRYVDDSGAATEAYPANPNGSPQGITALCSPDGRHLAMMPHPERCTHMWQMPYVAKELQHLPKDGPSPWLAMFQAAREWCESN